MNAIVAMDEAGNTGQNLLDPEQPVYALAGLHIGPDLARQLVRASLAKRQESELKFATLRRRASGRRGLIDLLRTADLTNAEVKVALAHKSWMVTAKMVDVLIEPRMAAKGLHEGFYGQGLHVMISDELHHRAEDEIGSSWTELKTAFVGMVREYGDATVSAYLHRLERARLACRDERLHSALSAMLDTRTELDDEIGNSMDLLNPAPTLVSWQASTWSEQFGEEPFSVVHDEATAVPDWVNVLVQAGQASASEITMGQVKVRFPIGLQDVTFARSHDDPRVQIADLIAGSCAWVYSAIVGLRTEDSFVSELEQLGIKRWMEHYLAPTLPENVARRLRG